jgi:hypothetical protein
MTTKNEDALLLVVDRGQPVIVEAAFDGDPDEVYFSYTRPQEERPYIDDGYGQPKSLIERLERGLYRYTISTRGFKDGEGEWHFWGEWAQPRPAGYSEAHVRGTYRIRPASAVLL